MKKLLLALLVCVSAHVAQPLPSPRPIDIGYAVTLGSAAGVAWTYYKKWQLNKKLNTICPQGEHFNERFDQLTQTQKNEYHSLCGQLYRNFDQRVGLFGLCVLSLLYTLNPELNPDLFRLYHNYYYSHA